MTLWQFQAMIIEHNKIGKKPGDKDDRPMTPDEYDEMKNRLRELNLPNVKV